MGRDSAGPASAAAAAAPAASAAAPVPEHVKQALAAWADSPVVVDICDANGVSRDEFVHHRARVEQLEVFLMAVTSLRIVSWFPNLVRLQVMHQNLDRIEGLEQLQCLEYLWLNENNIPKIEGLQGCTNLRELYLYSNRISRIEGLDSLARLEVLWLHDNNISEIEGLDRLYNLRVLWLARNRITSVGHRLDANANLHELNVAANYIGSFREIPYLDRLANLRLLYFSDPHFGDNPVCQLCNYQTYTLYHLNKIKVLDYQSVSEESRHLAEATFVKKKMYYNMRIKTLRRNTSNLIKKAAQFKLTKFSEINLSLNVLVRMAKELERELDEARHLPPPAGGAEEGGEPPLDLSAVESKLRLVRATIQQKMREVEAIDTRFSSMKGIIESISQHNISRLLVELQTGGNIRMEEGKPTDVWYQSCVDLVRSRFFPVDFEPFGIKDVRITKVTRIHNRFLRNRFEDRLDHLVDTSNPVYKKALEYLFYGEDPELSGELTTAIEEGFRAPAEYESASKDAGVPLSNSVFICEQARLLALYRQGVIGNSSLKGQPAQPPARRSLVDADAGQLGLVGRLLITKVFLGKCQMERGDPGRSRGEDGDDDQPPAAAAAPHLGSFEPILAPAAAAHKMRRRDYPSSCGSVYRVKQGDAKQRVWFCFDHFLILPEYLVELVYVPLPHAFPTANLPLSSLVDHGSDERLDELQDVINKLVATRSEMDAADIRSFAHYFLSFVHQCNTIVSSDKHISSEVLSSPPIPKQRPKVSVLDADLILKGCRVPSLSQVSYLNFFGNHIRKMDIVHDCVCLKVLILSFNEVQRIEGVQDLPHLHTLDLSFNLIKRIENLRGLPSLTKLELNNNLIYRLEDVAVLKRSVPTVTDLSLQNNAICEVKSYKYIVLRHMPGLKVMDGKQLTEDDARAAQEKMCQISPELIITHSHTQPTLGWALTLQPVGATAPVPHWKDVMRGREARRAGAEHAIETEAADGSRSGEGGSDSDGERQSTSRRQVSKREEHLLSKVLEVDLGKMRLRKIQGLDRCKNIQIANFADNEISRIEGLDNCLRIEELNLEDNRIIKIENLGTLSNLKKLDLGKNKINKIEGLDNLPHLCQLSLEDNDIYSLQGAQRIPNLMELYIGNNKIDSIKEINHLRCVHKLIILDLSGNPLCNDADYRLFSIFSLKKLKVLDGVPIDAGESNRAKETFAGKMTAELLAEKVGSSQDWASVTELNLSQCSIKELSLLEQFPSLLHLKCDHNLLSDVSGLRASTSLLSLNLNYNRITTQERPQGAAACANCFGRNLEQLAFIESLSLEGNGIVSIAALGLRLPNLKFLNLRSNDITRVDGLEGLPQLREVIVDRNKIRGFDERSFVSCVNLRDLRAEENLVKNLDGLKPLINLNRLFLTANRISDLLELEKLDGLDKLLEIYVTGNAVARKSLYRPTLIHRLLSCLVIDGKEVTPEEREKAELFFNQEYYTYQHPPNVYTDRSAALMSMPAVQAAQQAQVAKGAVKLVSFEYHDSSTPGPTYYQHESTVRPQAMQAHVVPPQRGRSGVGPPQPTRSSSGMRGGSADGSAHARDAQHVAPHGHWSGPGRGPPQGGRQRDAVVPQAKPAARQRPAYSHPSYTSPRPGTGGAVAPKPGPQRL
eukprot:TRINITY_DN4997_c0_g3_i1.p1 TRINITY_DN4997_c0_g3~~TRINITY_DN4997_c0_g3_i1.p1  ORF type:complete len:1660 (+),score=672.78 TRINITY_DN4997_c0_g3_i1:84-4982(+)